MDSSFPTARWGALLVAVSLVLSACVDSHISNSGNGGTTGTTGSTTGDTGSTTGNTTGTPTGNPTGSTTGTTTGETTGTTGETTGGTNPPTPKIVGKVLGAAIRYPTGHAKSSAAGVDYQQSTTGDSVLWSAQGIAYKDATVCVDVNSNGYCDAGEDAATSAEDGSFTITTTQQGPLTAIVGANASYLDPNSAARKNVAGKMILRARLNQVTAAGTGPVLISALSSEVMRTMQSDKLSYADAQATLATRLSLHNTPALASDANVLPAQVLSELPALSDGNARNALLLETVALQNRFALASTILERGYISTFAVDPVKTIAAAQAAAFNLEDIPRYDHLFIVIFENHANSTIDSPLFANFYKYLHVEGNRAANYFSVGNPSEPNYVAVASGDTWGITGDSAWNCIPDGDTADTPTDVYNPRGTCTDDASHNQKGRRNLFTSLYQAGLGARVYSESMDPGQDPRLDGQGNSAIKGANKASGKSEPMISDLYKIKHHPAMFFDEVRNRPDFFRNLARSVGGGQWDASIDAYAKTKNIAWNTHQLEDDLKSGDIGALNFIVPDQCDDIHTTGTEVGDCTQLAYLATGILRGDAYAKYLVDTIQASPVWKNKARKVGIVFIFDEGSVFFGSSSCCGWNVGGKASSGAPLDEGITTPVPAYSAGNKGDGPTIFAVLNNQPNAPKGITDSDSYSHFSLTRTLQNMFGLADPGIATSYMNRSKYTEAYIAANLGKLPEYAGSADPHFDAVRAMNHKYVMKFGDRISGGLTPGIAGSGSFGLGALALGPDPTQTNIWALK